MLRVIASQPLLSNSDGTHLLQERVFSGSCYFDDVTYLKMLFSFSFSEVDLDSGRRVQFFLLLPPRAVFPPTASNSPSNSRPHSALPSVGSLPPVSTCLCPLASISTPVYLPVSISTRLCRRLFQSTLQSSHFFVKQSSFQRRRF